MRKESKWYTTKTNTEESSNVGNKKQKDIRHTENNEQNGRSHSLSVITYYFFGLKQQKFLFS